MSNATSNPSYDDSCLDYNCIVILKHRLTNPDPGLIMAAMTKRTRATILLPLLFLGCVPKIPVESAPLPAPPPIQYEQKAGNITVVSALNGDRLAVALSFPKLCHTLPYAWSQCGKIQPVANQMVLIALSSGSTFMAATTNAEGIATFNLNEATNTADAADSPVAWITIGSDRTAIDLTRAASFPSWRMSKVEADRKAEENRLEQAQIDYNQEREAKQEKQQAQAKAKADQAKAEADQERKLKSWPVVTLTQLLDYANNAAMWLAHKEGENLAQGSDPFQGIIHAWGLSIYVDACQVVRGGPQIISGIMLFRGDTNEEARRCSEFLVTVTGGPGHLVGIPGTNTFHLDPKYNKVRIRINGDVAKNKGQWAAETTAQCVESCLSELAFATRDHCEAKCRQQRANQLY